MKTFRSVMSHFPTGITVVTSRWKEDQHGMTCNAFCSVSIRPPTVMVSLTKGTRTHALIMESGKYAVNLLADEQSYLSDRFAGRHPDKESDRFQGIAWKAGITGVPVFEGVQAFLECQVAETFEGKDHTLFMGEVLTAGLFSERRPLVYCHSGYHRFGSLESI